MDSRLVLGLVLACACNAHLKDGDGTIDAPVHPDARPDGRTIDGPPDAYVFGPWSSPAPVTGASDSTLNIDDETLNSEMTELYFGIVDTTLTGTPKQLWMMTRSTPADAWGTPTRLDATFNVGGTTPPTEESPRLSPDDKTIYFGRGGDIYFATRTAIGQPWSSPLPLANVSTPNYEKWFAVCSGGYYLVARNSGTGTAFHLYQGQLGMSDSEATELAGATGNETASFLTADCTTTYFASSRSGTTQIYTATRSAPGSPWSSPTVLDTQFGTSTDNEDPWLSPDARTFYFSSARYGGTNTNKGVYCSTR